MKLVGHNKVLAAIPNPLPRSLLLVGPEGVGKRMLASQLTAANTDLANVQSIHKMTKQAAKVMVKWHQSAPVVAGPKITMCDITDASASALNATLKILEEPPPWSRFILYSHTEPPLTILSRCYVIRVGVLTDDEVDEVLRLKGIIQSDREDAVRASHGRVSVALDHAHNSDARNAVENVLRALLAGDGPGLERSLAAAMAAKQEDDVEQRNAYARKEVLADLLARSIRTSLSDPNHALTRVHVSFRVQALKSLEAKARPELRVKSAVWTLAAGL